MIDDVKWYPAATAPLGEWLRTRRASADGERVLAARVTTTEGDAWRTQLVGTGWDVEWVGRDKKSAQAPDEWRRS